MIVFFSLADDSHAVDIYHVVRLIMMSGKKACRGPFSSRTAHIFIRFGTVATSVRLFFSELKSFFSYSDCPFFFRLSS